MKRLILSIACVAAFGSGLEAATYTVKAGGGGDFATIQACANAAVAGDTCAVFAGIYNESVTLPTAGTGTNGVCSACIMFTVNPGDHAQVRGWTMNSYNIVNGFEVTGTVPGHPTAVDFAKPSTIGAQITNNTIHFTGNNVCIALERNVINSYNTIKGNTISWCASSAVNSGPGAPGIFVNGDHNLIEGNDISHVTDFIDYYGSYNVYRGNNLHDVLNYILEFPNHDGELHIDGLESDCLAPSSADIHTVIEGNFLYNNPTDQAHFLLAQDEGGCGSHSLIFRFNRGLHVGEYGVLDQAGGFWGVKLYNNTYVDFGGDICVDCFWSNSHHGAVLNNLYYNAIIASSPSSGVYCVVDDGSLTGFRGGSNLTYTTRGTRWSSADPCFRILRDPGNITNQDPKLVNPDSDFHLQPGSPAIGAGTYLAAAISSGSNSNSLVVNDADFFQDGYGIPGVQADWIRVGASTSVQISSINYATNTITLAAPISWSTGAQVYLYKDTSGNVVLNGPAPDIGALQHPRGDTIPAPPTNLRIVPPSLP
jgi:hypothetical protein